LIPERALSSLVAWSVESSHGHPCRLPPLPISLSRDSHIEPDQDRFDHTLRERCMARAAQGTCRLQRPPQGRVAPEPRLCRRFPGFDVAFTRAAHRATVARPPFTTDGLMPLLLLWATHHLPTSAINYQRMSTATSSPTLPAVEAILCFSRVASPPSVDNGAALCARRRSIRSVTRRQAGRVARGPERPLIAGRTLPGRTLRK
jgi:hypothetical protein